MTQAERKIRAYLAASAGTENRPTDHVLRCFVGMVESGEAAWFDFRNAGGDWLVREVLAMRERMEVMP